MRRMRYNGVERAGNETEYREAVWRAARVKPPPLGLGTEEESDATRSKPGCRSVNQRGLPAVDHRDAEQARSAHSGDVCLHCLSLGFSSL